ncbi:MAG: hypothetical protein NTY38_03275, partial [Acidobacteria bacterium]|nr:hypothetical protein [Acidobacteriota bacterium]
MIIRFVVALLCGVCFGQAPRLTYHADSRRISFGFVERARFGLSLDGKDRWAADAREGVWQAGTEGGGRLTLRFDAPAVEWTIEVRRGADGTSAVITSTIRNIGKAAVRLGRCRLADVTDSGSTVDLGQEAEKGVLLVASGAQTKTYVRTLRGEQHAVSRTLTQIYNPAAKRSLQL